MFCYQCQETGENKACMYLGACGKSDETANLQDLLIHTLRGIALAAEPSRAAGLPEREAGLCVARGLFATVTNTNFDPERIAVLVEQALELRDALRARHEGALAGVAHDALTWHGRGTDELRRRSVTVDIRDTRDEDVRSLRELATYGLKGAGAYLAHAAVLGLVDDALLARMLHALAGTATLSDEAELGALALDVGRVMVDAMALLDTANAAAYGEPTATRVRLGVGSRPGILVTGHDLRDLEELLEQTAGSGVDVYTHCEMWAAHAYPRLAAHPHLVGNYGNAWWLQEEEFESFGGPVLVTSNCIVPPRESYRQRLFTTSVAGFPGVAHIPDAPGGGPKDFSPLVALARRCQPPRSLEGGEVSGGFSHRFVGRHLGTVCDLVQRGKISRFVVMAGCDGRDGRREHFTRAALALPPDAVILTAGCAKFRYIKQVHGEIEGLPRVLDAGQCNDCYSLVRIALALKEALGVASVNDLPIEYDLAWYDQKAVGIVLGLAALGVKGLHMGPTLPAYLRTPAGRRFAARHEIRPTALSPSG